MTFYRKLDELTASDGVADKYPNHRQYHPYIIRVSHSEPLHKLTVDSEVGREGGEGRGSRWPKSLFVRLAGQSRGGEHCWRRSEDKTRHSPGHAWATRLAPDLHTVHKQASGPTGSYTHTHTQPAPGYAHTHTHMAVDVKRGQGLTVGKSIHFIIGEDYRRRKRTITNLHKGARG